MPASLPSASQIASDIRSQSISPVEVAKEHIERIKAINPMLNAFVDIQPERVLEQARRAEQALRDGNEVGPLHGVPVSVKASIQVAGHLWEAGSRLRAGEIATQDAPL